MRKLKYTVGFALLSLFALALNLYSQGPTSIDTSKPEKVPFTLPNILIFIVLPAILFIFYLWWIRQKKKEYEKKREQEQDS